MTSNKFLTAALFGAVIGMGIQQVLHRFVTMRVLQGQTSEISFAGTPVCDRDCQSEEACDGSCETTEGCCGETEGDFLISRATALDHLSKMRRDFYKGLCDDCTKTCLGCGHLINPEASS